MFTRKTPLLLLTALIGLCLIGCGETEFTVPKGYKLVKIGSPPPQLNDSTAIAWTSDWRDKMADPTFLPANPIQAFAIPHTDINASFTSTESRAYLGLDMSIAPPEYHLVIVGMDANGNDDTSKIYDLTLPCPTVCDTSSFLYYSRK